MLSPLIAFLLTLQHVVYFTARGVTTIGEMIFAPVTGAYVSGLAPERFRGRYMGVWHAMFSFGMVLGPAMGTWIYQRNPTALWWTCFGMGIAAAILSMWKERRPPEPPASYGEYLNLQVGDGNEGYVRTPNYMRELVGQRTYLHKLAPVLPREGLIVDCAAGDGLTLVELKILGFRIAGILLDRHHQEALE